MNEHNHQTSYDQIPYDSKPIERTYLEHLAVIARLFGVQSPTPNRSAILELGCASGHNLFGMAAAFPQSRFVGIDLSSVQIDEGKKTLKEVQLQNLELNHMSILDINKDFGQFDYIICHGIFSWVPDEVRNKIMEIFRDNLSANGAAFISYNTFPGWHIRKTIRDMMLYQAAHLEEPAARIEAARKALDFLARTIGPMNAYTEAFKAELETIRRLPDWYMFHDLLEEHNQPFYFHDFMDLAEQYSLQYLADAEIPKLLPQEFPPGIQQAVNKLSSDVIRREQYMDFLRNRMFRRTVLVHAGIPLDRRLEPKLVESFHIASRMKPVSEVPDIYQDGVEESFKSPNGGMLKTALPLAKAALVYLGKIWPSSISFTDLLAEAVSSLCQDDADDVTLSGEEVHIASTVFLRGYLADLIEFRISEHICRAKPDERPQVSALARFQALQSGPITNLLNEHVTLSQFDRTLLTLLDGNKEVSQLCDDLGGYKREEADWQIDPESPDDEETQLSNAIQESLIRIASQALLV